MNEKRLNRFLARWVEQGLITAEQGERIRAHEQSKSTISRGRWVLYGLLITGGCVLSIGVISLVATNWQEIPDSIKLLVDFAALTSLALALYRAHDREREMLFDLLATIFILFCLASTGLISQIFHIGWSFDQAAFITLAIVFPLSYLSKKWFLPHLWVVGFLTAFLLSTLGRNSWWAVTFHCRNWEDFFPLFLILPLLSLALGNVTTQFTGLKRYANGFFLWSFILVFVAIAASDAFCSSGDARLRWLPFLPAVISGILAIATLFWQKELHPKARFIAIALILLSLSVYLPPILGGRILRVWGEIFGATYSVIALLLMAAFFALYNHKFFFNLMTILITLRFLIVYFQVIGDLAKTGLGLIVSGLLIIGMAVAWYKLRARIEIWFGGLLK